MSRFDMKVKVVAKSDSNAEDGVSFHLEDEDGCVLESVVFEKAKHGMKHEDEHLVRFKLVQEQGMTLEFAQGKDVAFWAAQGTDKLIPKCPKTQPPQPNPIFYGEKSNGNTLTAVNTNPSCCYFSFALNFVDPNSTRPTKLITYDPVGENKNGGISGAHQWTATNIGLAVGAVAAVAAIAIFALR